MLKNHMKTWFLNTMIENPMNLYGLWCCLIISLYRFMVARSSSTASTMTTPLEVGVIPAKPSAQQLAECVTIWESLYHCF